MQADPVHWLAGLTHRFLAGALPEGARVLEVGCGRGHVARLLGADGFPVTALDLRLEEPRPWPHVRYVEHDFLGFEDEPYDAVVFTASLHHIHPLDAAIDRTMRLLQPGGLLIADEFDVAAPDEATCRWNCDMESLFHLEGKPGDQLERWRAEHEHDPPLHIGAQMLEAIYASFELQDVTRGAYLYRSFAPRFTDGATAKASAIRRQELRLIGTGEIRPVGLRIVAQRSAAELGK